MNSFLVLDLETVLDTSLPPPPKKKSGGDVFPPPPYHTIVAMGAALLDASCRLRSAWIVSEGRDEFTMLAALIAFLNAKLAEGIVVTIVTWNGRGFDLPVLVARCLHHGLAWPWYYETEARRRYSAHNHIDMMDLLVDHGAARPYGLSLAAKLIGMPGKLDVNGGNVQAMMDAGEHEQVRAYCVQDVIQTAALFLRVQLLRGALSPAGYAIAAEHLLATVEREPRLAPLLPLIDRDRFLITGGAAELVHEASAARQTSRRGWWTKTWGGKTT
ncbi:ribonuclease H-like domain-containing protein [Chondromyces apiculatus]|uniref:Polysaccharide biosynthesis protein WlaX n=1 Tax=Chondromyces apiculatus DSM 436 TaxID=1192034 RepID=A0A017T9V1_9BACT|nr:ribonuclease H-like domain-containing protein [Chondromyces apiculatus]EYF06014.1 Polysaccharide biosynthesis protein WlaX [Chondromyces apiculatus DSM 436]